jgi:phytoene desaturase
MYAETSRFFRDDRLRAALTFQTMYLGISPFASPAVYGLLPYTELADGIWYPRGGMFELPLALERLARELGVRFHYGTPVRKILIERGRAHGVRLDGGDAPADVVLCNADLPWAYRNLLDAREAPLRGARRLEYTSSAFMLYLGVRRRHPMLGHHTVVFGREYRGAFDDIFRRLRVPADPAFYVNVSARSDAGAAPAGKDNVYVLVPVPHRDAGIDWAAEGPQLRDRVLARLAELGADLRDDIEAERAFTPDDWATELNLERGSAFGLSHDFFQVGPFRPANQDRNVPNLFFVGASTQPGTGLPMVMLSARLVTERICAHARAHAGRRARRPIPIDVRRAS